MGILDYFKIWKKQPKEELYKATFLNKEETTESVKTTTIASCDYCMVFVEEDMKTKTVLVEISFPEREVDKLAKIPLDKKFSMAIKTKYSLMQLDNARVYKRQYDGYGKMYELYIDAPFAECV